MFESATAHETVAVTDLGRAKEFYGETLGFEVMDERSDGVTYKDAERASAQSGPGGRRYLL